jgi:O-antigen ligase
MSERRPELIMLVLAVFGAAVIGGQVPVIVLPFGGPMAALIGGAESPLLTRALLGLLVFGALGLVLVKNRSVVLPKQRISLSIGLLVLAMCVAIASSSFAMTSFDSWLHWVVYAGVFGLACTASGRSFGPRAVLSAAWAGGFIAALRGLSEYLAVWRIEPGHRIFAGWSNPNAAAGLFILTLPLGLALMANAKRPAERFVYGLGTTFIGVGLLLTQSKGGYLAGLIGLAALGICLLVWKQGKKSLIALAPLAAAGAIMFALTAAAPSAAQNGALGRISGQSGEATQSRAFRVNLWKSSVELIKEKPGGWGPGSFAHESGRPGLVMPTVYAHQAYLQTAVEGGIFALFLLLAAAFFWLVEMFKSAKSMTSEQNLLRAGVVGCVVAAGAHGMIESNFAYLGIGVLVFAVMGVGLQLSVDGSAPELIPRPIRLAGALALCVGPLMMLFVSARGEAMRSNLLTAAAGSSLEAVETAAGALAASASDGEGIYLAARYTPDEEERFKLLEKSARIWPTLKVYREIARQQKNEGMYGSAAASIEQSLVRDPNNLPSLGLLLDVHIAGSDYVNAEAVARRLMAVEQTTYYQVRALAELVPTETARARVWLAARSSDPAEKKELLEPAIGIIREFADKTLPMVLMMAEGDLEYAGVGVDDARTVLEMGRDAANQVGDSESVLTFSESLDSLSS